MQYRKTRGKICWLLTTLKGEAVAILIALEEIANGINENVVPFIDSQMGMLLNHYRS